MPMGSRRMLLRLWIRSRGLDRLRKARIVTALVSQLKGSGKHNRGGLRVRGPKTDYERAHIVTHKGKPGTQVIAST